MKKFKGDNSLIPSGKWEKGVINITEPTMISPQEYKSHHQSDDIKNKLDNSDPIPAFLRCIDFNFTVIPADQGNINKKGKFIENQYNCQESLENVQKEVSPPKTSSESAQNWLQKNKSFPNIINLREKKLTSFGMYKNAVRKKDNYPLLKDESNSLSESPQVDDGSIEKGSIPKMVIVKDMMDKSQYKGPMHLVFDLYK